MSRVSVVVPTFNRAGLVVRAVRSAFAQSYPGIEVVVVDDGSTDNTERAVRLVDDRVRYLRIDHTGLPAVARNRGIEASSGDYVAFLDSDDEWLPHKLERQIEQLELNPRAGLACSNARVAGSDRLYLRRDQGASGRVWRTLLRENFVIASTAVVRRKELEVSGRFSENPVLRAIEDYDLWLRMAALSEVIFDPEALAVYTDGGVSLRSDLTIADYKAALELALQRAADFASLHPGRGVVEGAARKELQNRFSSRQTALEKARSALGRKSKPIAAPEGLKLHLGCGERYLSGYVNVDLPTTEHSVQTRTKVDVEADIATLKYESGSIAEIRLHHVLEHFARQTALRLLIQWHDWLVEGGILVLETPDFERTIRKTWRSRDPRARMKALRHIFGSNEAAWAVHADGWYREKFTLVLESLGFGDLRFEYGEWQGTHNVTVTARKIVPVRSRDAQLRAAEQLLRMSLVDDSASEQRLLAAWLEQIRTELGDQGPR